MSAAITEPFDLQRSAAYLAARDALVAIHDASTTWPAAAAHDARRAAVAMVATTADALRHPAGTSTRSRCVREALVAALTLVAALDVAQASGVDGTGIVQAGQQTGRTVALLGLLLHANTIVAESR